MEKLGVEKLEDVIVSAAHVANAVSAFAHKQGLLALYPIIAEAQSLVKTDWDGVKQEIMDCSAEESEKLQKALSSALMLQNPNVEPKLLEWMDMVQEIVAFAIAKIELGKVAVEEGKVLAEKVKAMVSK